MDHTLHIRILEGSISSDKNYDRVFCHLTYNKTNFRTRSFDGSKCEEEFDLDVEDITEGEVVFYLANKTKFSEKDLAYLKIDIPSLKLGEAVTQKWKFAACPDAHKVEYGRVKMTLLLTENGADSSGCAESSELLNSLKQENKQLKSQYSELESKISSLKEENHAIVSQQSFYDNDSPQQSDDPDSNQNSDDSDSNQHYSSSKSPKIDNKSIQNGISSLQYDNDRVKAENDEIMKFNEYYINENIEIENANESISKDIDQLNIDGTKLSNESNELMSKIESLECEKAELANNKKEAVKKMTERIKELEEINEQLSTQNTKMKGKADFLSEENKLLLKHVHSFVSAALKAKESFNIKNDQ